MASALSELKSAQALGNSWTGVKPGHSGILDGSSGATLTIDEIPAEYRTQDMIETLPSDQSASSALDPNGVDWIGYNQNGPSWHNPFGTSASAQNPQTPQPYAFMDTSLASMFGMDPATHYQEALSNTSYQRAVRDLQAAGLNPVLGISRGAAVFPGIADPMALYGSYGGSSGGSYVSSGSGKSTSDLAGTAQKLQYWLPTLANGVVNMAVSLSPIGKKNPFAGFGAGQVAQNIVSGVLGAIRNHA